MYFVKFDSNLGGISVSIVLVVFLFFCRVIFVLFIFVLFFSLFRNFFLKRLFITD